MIILLSADVRPDQVEAITGRVRELGLDLAPLDDRRGRAFEVIGEDPGAVLELRRAPGIAGIMTRRTPLDRGEPLWPHFALRLSILALLLVTALVLLTAYAPPGLADKAGPDQPPAMEWHLRPLAGFMRLLPGAIGGTAVLLAWLLFLAWPFLDRADENTPAGRRTARIIRAAGVALLVFVIVLGVTG
jgi:quinol-cytochrome oxidoreductase complex cytochrome b subunit